MDFQCLQTDGSARAGWLSNGRGVSVATPAFMPVGTQGVVKGMTPTELWDLGYRLLLANTYHLALRPGAEVVAKLGGLRQMMRWNGALLTDSGGYQIFSLARQVRVLEEGARFRSHLDGSLLMLTPEEAFRIQTALGVDIALCLDQLIALPATSAALREATQRTLRWAERTLTARGLQESPSREKGGTAPAGGPATGPAPGPAPKPALWAIVQGGLDPELRQHCIAALLEMSDRHPPPTSFDGYALGGFSVGEDRSARQEVLSAVLPALPPEKPRYLMGSGEPEDILHAIGEGVDLFDCVLPTRNARNGSLYTTRGKVSIRQRHYREAAESIARR